jgi:uncharacterized membrane-anchored protein
MKKFFFILVLTSSTLLSFAKDKPKNAEIDSVALMRAAIEKQLTYQTGEVSIGNNLAKVKLPKGFRFLDEKQSKFVVYEVWGNPENKENKLYGMIVPEKTGVTDDNSWAFVIQYDEMGYVKDDDADKINYDDLLKEMQSGEAAANQERAKAGYSNIKLVGWAQKPYYDRQKKVLHWAKEIAFGDTPEHTLNYNIRVLGRKGVLVLNAVGGMKQLPEIKTQLDGILNSVQYEQGNSYADFNPSADKIAAVTVGGLVAGKVLAKAGLLAGLAKFGKVLFLAIAGVFSLIWRWVTGRKDEPETENNP